MSCESIFCPPSRCVGWEAIWECINDEVVQRTASNPLTKDQRNARVDYILYLYLNERIFQEENQQSRLPFANRISELVLSPDQVGPTKTRTIDQDEPEKKRFLTRRNYLNILSQDEANEIKERYQTTEAYLRALSRTEEFNRQRDIELERWASENGLSPATPVINSGGCCEKVT